MRTVRAPSARAGLSMRMARMASARRVMPSQLQVANRRCSAGPERTPHPNASQLPSSAARSKAKQVFKHICNHSTLCGAISTLVRGDFGTTSTLFGFAALCPQAPPWPRIASSCSLPSLLVRSKRSNSDKRFIFRSKLDFKTPSAQIEPTLVNDTSTWSPYISTHTSCRF